MSACTGGEGRGEMKLGEGKDGTQPVGYLTSPYTPYREDNN